MRLDLHLHLLNGALGGHLDWNPATRELAGPLAGEVEAIIAMAMAEGGVVTHPYPTVYEIHNPRHDPAELGLLLGQFWRVPESLGGRRGGGGLSRASGRPEGAVS